MDIDKPTLKDLKDLGIAEEKAQQMVDENNFSVAESFVESFVITDEVAQHAANKVISHKRKRDEELKKLSKAKKEASYGSIADIIVMRMAWNDGQSKLEQIITSKSQWPPYLADLINTLVNYHNVYDPNIHYSPYFYIAQSSSWGKSSVITSLMRTQCYGIYICTRRKNGGAYPPSDTQLTTIFNQYQAYDWIAFFIELFTTFRTYLQQSNSINSAQDYQKWYQQCSDFKEDEAVYQRQIATQAQIKARSLFPTIVPATSTPEQLKQLDAERIKLVVEMNSIWDDCNRLLNNTNNNNLRFLLFVDEINDLNETSRADLIRVLAEWKGKGRFAVFADTNSSIRDIAPAQVHHPSNRVRVLGRQIFPPYSHFGRYDPYNELKVNEINFPNCMTHKIIHSIGRPLWSAYVNANFNDLTTFAFQKLVGAHNEQDLLDMITKQTVSNTTLLAIISQLIPLNINPLAIECNDLPKNHMATIVKVSEDRFAVTMNYINEPVLADSALRRVMRPDKKLFKALLDCLADIQSTSIVNPGQMGEVIGCVILLFTAGTCFNYPIEQTPIVAQDINLFSQLGTLASSRNIFGTSESANINQPTSSNINVPQQVEPTVQKQEDSPRLPVTTVQDFINILFGFIDKSSSKLLYNNFQLAKFTTSCRISTNGMINIRQFIRAGKKDVFTLKLLLYCFTHGVGIAFPENHPGADLLIPVYLHSTSVTSNQLNQLKQSQSFQLNPNNMTAILIQIKNHDKREGRVHYNATELLEWDNVMFEKSTNPYLTLYMSLRVTDKNTPEIRCYHDEYVDKTAQQPRGKKTEAKSTDPNHIPLALIGLTYSIDIEGIIQRILASSTYEVPDDVEPLQTPNDIPLVNKMFPPV